MVSVAENYQKLFLTPLNRYQDFSNEAGRYIVRLENQRAIFQTQCILLLSTVIDTPAASQIVSATHKLAPAAKAEVEERLKSVLGDSRTAIIGTIRAINAALLATQRECKELSETVEKEDKGKKKKRKISDLNMLSSWKSHIRQKLKFSFSESHLSANLKTLTDLNQDFVTLSSLFQFPSKSGEQSSTHSLNERLIDKHRLIGMAAEEVWNFLHSLECDGCEQHWAHLGIGDERVNQDETASGLAKFNVALSCTRTSLDLTRFVVTTKLQERDPQNHLERLAELKGALRSILKIEKGSAEMLEKGVEHHDTTKVSNSAPDGGQCTRRAHSRQGDERRARKLCPFLNHPEFDRVSGPLQAFSACDEGAKGAKLKAICKHSPDVLRSTTLSDLLQDCRGDRPRNGLPVPERLRLAKVVTVAYFRFHSTGWANSGWNSNGICFQWTNHDDIMFNVKGLQMPYLQSRVNSTSSFSTISSSTSNVCQSPPTCGLSTAGIFKLGILLLEIGYSMNWDTLKRRCPSQYGDDDPHSAMLQARLILANEIPEMGGMYTKIISSLVEGTFSNIIDSDERKLEAAFMEAVVRPLEWEERRLEEFLNFTHPPWGNNSGPLADMVDHGEMHS
ncbi:MAG: hypothetical protein OHK93_004640 [Ramalina farinacea]|uniref:Uncharacterized protein n=1 Tax=Ramalina farinacea TaxID=258253 RepID=A0AA43U1T7_9LECA|nr:hypothetical protein [Ramalina farinacea]